MTNDTVSACCGGGVVPYYPDPFKPSVNTCSVCGKKCTPTHSPTVEKWKKESDKLLKYLHGKECLPANFDEVVIKFVIESVQEAKAEERELIHKAFIKNFRGVGEVWFPYESEGNCTKEEELESVEEEWLTIIDTLNTKEKEI